MAGLTSNLSVLTVEPNSQVVGQVSSVSATIYESLMCLLSGMNVSSSLHTIASARLILHQSHAILVIHGLIPQVPQVDIADLNLFLLQSFRLLRRGSCQELTVT